MTNKEIAEKLEKLIHWCDLSLSGYKEALTEAAQIIRKLDSGLMVELPCKVGETVYVITQCKNVAIQRDDDYFTGTGAMECPFESSCDIEDCDDNHTRIFETEVKDFWFGEANGKILDVMFSGLLFSATSDDFGKTVFLTKEAAEKALNEVVPKKWAEEGENK